MLYGLIKYKIKNRTDFVNSDSSTVVPVFSNPLDERPPAVNDHVINVPKIVNVNVPQISVHLPNADADSNPLVIRICYKGQCKQIPCFRRPCYAKIARDRYNLR